MCGRSSASSTGLVGHVDEDEASFVFGASRLAMASELVLALLAAGALLCWCGPAWALAMLLPIAMTLRHYRRRSPLRLRCPDGQRWEVRKAHWCPVELTVHRLGPGIIELDLDGRHYCLWPDSADRVVLRRLRRILLRQQSEQTASVGEPAPP